MEAGEPRELTCSSSFSVSVRWKKHRAGWLAGVVGGLLGLPPPVSWSFPFSFFHFFFFVEKKREGKKGNLGHKNYNNNFYELPTLKSSKAQVFGSEIFKVSYCLNLKFELANWV